MNYDPERTVNIKRVERRKTERDLKITQNHLIHLWDIL